MTTSDPQLRKEALLEKLRGLCPMSRQTHAFYGREIRIWKACDLDPLLDAMEIKPASHPDIVDERMPYWAELWPSARALAETILSPRRRLPADQWIELGCGPGLAGLAAGMRGAGGILTDYEPAALWLAELNAIENGMENIRVRRVDWREPPPDLRTAWILASDVAYEERNFQPLIDCFDSLLTPGGEIWLAEPGRSVARPFFDELEEAGWRRKSLGHRQSVTIHRFRRSTSR